MVYHLITVHPYSSVIIYYNSPLIHTFARDGRKLSNVNKFTACVEIRYTRPSWTHVFFLLQNDKQLASARLEATCESSCLKRAVANDGDARSTIHGTSVRAMTMNQGNRLGNR